MRSHWLFALVLTLALTPISAWSEAADSHEAAVLQLVERLNLREQITASSRAMIDAQVQTNPQLGDYRDTMIAWVNQYLSWDAFAEDFVKLYKEAFTEAEVRELIAFYNTPIGRKSLEKMPALMQQGSLIGADVARRHQPELEEMVAARRAELQQAESKDDSNDDSNDEPAP